MSIHHEVSVHCDGCGHWEHGDVRTTRQRRAAGWLIWRDDDGHGRYLHLCPKCAREGRRTEEGGERPATAPPDDALATVRGAR